MKVLKGRRVIYSTLNDDMLSSNKGDEYLKAELEAIVLPIHQQNVEDYDFLENYYLGEHPGIINRTKITREEINNKIIVNFAKSFTRDIVAYFLGKPIQYVHRDADKRDALKQLVDALSAEDKNTVDYEIANNCSIMGVGYRGCFATANDKNGTHLRMESLHPRETFVVESPDKEIGVLYCGTFYTAFDDPYKQTSKTVFTVYTRKHKYVFESPATPDNLLTVSASFGELTLKEKTPYSYGGNLPIIQYKNNAHMTGDWESEISIMDSLDQLPSDALNDVEQFVNSILVAQGFEVTDEIVDTLERDKILNITDVPPGVNVVVKYIAEQLDSGNIEGVRDWLEATMRVVVGVPDRKSRGGGGDTGDAVFLRDGWQDIDLVAVSKEQYFIKSDREMLNVVLEILKTFREVDKNLQPCDIDIKFARTKQSNMQVKAQTYATLVGATHPLAPEDALEMADLTNNVTDVIMRSEDYAKEREEKAIALQRQAIESNPNNTQSTPKVGENQVKSKIGDKKKAAE